MSCALESRVARGTAKAILPNFRTATRQHVLEEPREEHVHRERDAPCLVGARERVPERDAIVRAALQPVVGEGNVVDVAREIARRVRPAADRLPLTVQDVFHTRGSTAPVRPARATASRMFARKMGDRA